MMTNHDESKLSVRPLSGETDSRLKALGAARSVLVATARSLTRIPLLKELAAVRHRFRNSSSYWERRYRRGGTSGAGSYGRLAEFKAETLNAFVARNGIRSVIEFGCGDGAQLSLATYPQYVGVDVAKSSVAACRRRFAGDATKTFYLANRVPSDIRRFDLALSLDVIYHLVEDQVYDGYMRTLFAQADRFVVIYSSNKVEPSDSPHVRHRRFTDWIKLNEPKWQQTGYLPNRYPSDPARSEAETSFADFYFFEQQTRADAH